MCGVLSLTEFGKVVSVSGQGTLRRRRSMKKKKKKNQTKITGVPGRCPELLIISGKLLIKNYITSKGAVSHTVLY